MYGDHPWIIEIAINSRQHGQTAWAEQGEVNSPELRIGEGSQLLNQRRVLPRQRGGQASRYHSRRGVAVLARSHLQREGRQGGPFSFSSCSCWCSSSCSWCWCATSPCVCVARACSWYGGTGVVGALRHRQLVRATKHNLQQPISQRNSESVPFRNSTAVTAATPYMYPIYRTDRRRQQKRQQPAAST
jgi:hypothetical protein